MTLFDYIYFFFIKKGMLGDGFLSPKIHFPNLREENEML
jgi:hypothetical protein